MKRRAHALAFVLIFGTACNAAGYSCQECLADLRKMAATAPARASQSALCRKICDETPAEAETILPELSLPPPRRDRVARETRLWLEISAIMRPYRMQAEQYCVLNGQAVAGAADRNCVRLILFRLAERPNVQKIMSAIGARPDEYDLVHSMIFDFANRGF